MLRLVDLGPSIPQLAIHFYDKAGFEVCSTGVEATAIHDSANAVVALAANGHFYCSRSDYNQVDRWNVDYRFPSLLAEAGQEKTAETKPPTLKNPSRPIRQITPQAADDTLTGFDLSSGHSRGEVRKNVPDLSGRGKKHRARMADLGGRYT